MNSKSYLQLGVFLAGFLTHIVSQFTLTTNSLWVIAVACFLIGCFSTAYFMKALRREKRSLK